MDATLVFLFESHFQGQERSKFVFWVFALIWTTINISIQTNYFMVDRSLIACGNRCGWMPPSFMNLKVIFKDKKGQNWYIGFWINLDHNQYFYPNKLFYVLTPNQCN